MSVFQASPWPLSKLSAICGSKEVIDPTRIPDREFSYIDIASVSNESFQITAPRRLVGRDAPSRARKRIRVGDVVVATTRPYLKSIACVPPDLDGEVCSTGFCVLRPTQSVASDWLFFCAQSADFIGQLTACMRGANYPAVTDRDVLDACIPLPPIEEQERIASRIRECIARVEEVGLLRTESLRERAFLAESVIEAELAALDGDEVAMANVCSITSKLVDPRESDYQEMLHVGGANIATKTGRLIDLKTAAEENLKSGKFVFDASMVLYNKIRPYLMKVARPEFSGLCSADMYPLAPKAGRITRDFLYYVLMSRRFTDYAIVGSNRAGMPKVNRDHLFAYRFTLPALQVQKRISERLDAAIESIFQLGHEMSESALEALALREAIIRKAFAGEL